MIQSGMWVLRAAGGVLLHFLVSVALLFALISSAYSFAASVPGGGYVGGIDELYKLGPSPSLGAAALALVGILDFLITVPLVAIGPTRSRAWIVPAVGIALSVLIVVVATLAFTSPPPDIGG